MRTMSQHIRLLQENMAALTPPSRNLTPNPPTDRDTPPLQLVSAPSASERRRPVLPDPIKFEGARSKFRPWIIEMRNKITTDGSVIGSPPDQFNYIFSRLGGTAQMMASTYAESTTSLKTTQDFLSYLESCYGDPNASAGAAIRLREIIQKDNESFATFLPKFEREMAYAGGAGWPDIVQINYLEAALNKKMAAQLIPMTQLPTTYREYIHTLQALGSRLESFELTSKSRQVSRRSPSPKVGG